MSLNVCTACTTAYANSLTACPNCGHDLEHEEIVAEPALPPRGRRRSAGASEPEPPAEA